MSLPIALTCGDPNGIGIDISFEAKKILTNSIPFFLIADIDHVKLRNKSQDYIRIQHPEECFGLNEKILPIMHHSFPEIPTLKGLQPGNALATTEVIRRAVEMYKNQEIGAFKDISPTEISDLVINERNKNWIDDIINLIENEPTFIAVSKYIPYKQKMHIH